MAAEESVSQRVVLPKTDRANNDLARPVIGKNDPSTYSANVMSDVLRSGIISRRPMMITSEEKHEEEGHREDHEIFLVALVAFLVAGKVEESTLNRLCLPCARVGEGSERGYFEIRNFIMIALLSYRLAATIILRDYV